MLLKKLKQNFRILPVFIFIAALTLSVRINNVFDEIKKQETQTISISQSEAFADERDTKETSELDKVLNNTDSTGNSRSTIGELNKSNFTQSEIMILQELAERREALDLRSREIDKKAVQLKVAENEIDKKLKQLQEYESKLRKLIKEYNTKEKEKLNSLVKMYSTMKPKDAARIFNTLDLEVAVSLLGEMKPSVSSAILSQMQSEKAKAVTDELIGYNIN